MSRHNVFKFLLWLVSVAYVECKTCETMDIRNNVTSLNKLRDCTEIAGNLKILLIEQVFDESEFDDYVFPNLTKISGYLFFYKVHYLTSIGKMFPNLRMVRGSDLFTDYSIVIYHMPHLREIALKNLMLVSRGSVRIDKCPVLCYADTINWHSMKTRIDFINTNNGTCESCPRHCLGNCWNMHTCQVIPSENCHEECLGCSIDNSASHCWVCKNYDDHGTCVPECFKNATEILYQHKYQNKCLTKKECKSFSNGTWWTFDGACINECPLEYEILQTSNGTTCRYCGHNCTKWCRGVTIDSLDKFNKLQGCTHIDGSLSIKLAGIDIRTENIIVDELYEKLKSVRYIKNSLVITWTKAIRSLNFLKNLEEIEGVDLIDKSHVLLFRENQNLQKLWEFDDNFKLKIKNGTFDFHYNPQLCRSEIAKLYNLTGVVEDFSPLSVYGNGDKSACNFVDLKVSVNASIKHASLSWETVALTDDTYLGFTVYYIEHSQGNISTFKSKDVCEEKGWKSQFCTNNSIILANLAPFTRYAYYIKIYRSSMEGAQSNLSYFKTMPDDPEGLESFEAKAKDHHTLTLSWEKPKNVNGVLSHYHLYVIEVPDRKVYLERDYCLYPRTEEGSDTSHKEMEKAVLTHNKTIFPGNNCSCSETEPATEEISIFIGGFHAPFCDIKSLSKFGFDRCKHLFYQFEFKKQTSISDKQPRSSPSILQVTESPSGGKSFETNIPANFTKYDLTNLQHYTLYYCFMRACNEGNRCGPVEASFARTLKKEDADHIEYVEVTVEDTTVAVTWKEPNQANSMIVSYNVEYSKTDQERSKPMIECVPRTGNRKKRDLSHTQSLSTLLPGEYTVRVQAVSLAGPGTFSKRAVFEIEAPARNSRWVIPVIIVTFVLVIGAVILYMWYKRKHKLDNIHLIATINPDYDGAIYIEDEWEVDRNDIELLNDLGHGTFGTVYCGIIKSRNMPCAIKTVNENISLHERMEFLNEASVMKAFSNSHHVVKLLGVVSKGQPPLVVMELMERGDLKKYLRRTRDSSQNITANEIYRMSIEIADGMSYLAAKKFVHRDLAARNCMVGHDRTVKIGDFGMARDIYETDYYRKETKGLLPVRWMAPESLADGVFSSDSDVWSYGIVLWEIATLAEQPYQGLSNEQVLQFVVSKGRLERPPECPDLLYEIMDACWYWRPNDRPTFADIVERLEDHVGQDFKLVSFIHSREGLEHKVTHGWERAYNPPALGMGAQEYDLYSHDNVSDEEVSLYIGDSSRPSILPSSLSEKVSSSDLY